MCNIDTQKELLNFHGDAGQSRGHRAATVQLTPLVISRIFEENITYQVGGGHRHVVVFTVLMY